MTENMIERLLDFEVTEHGTVAEEIELICFPVKKKARPPLPSGTPTR